MVFAQRQKLCFAMCNLGFAELLVELLAERLVPDSLDCKIVAKIVVEDTFVVVPELDYLWPALVLGIIVVDQDFETNPDGPLKDPQT